MRLCGGGTTSSASSLLTPSLAQVLALLIFQRIKLKICLYDVVSLSWPGKPLVISHNETNVIISKANRRKYIFLSQI